MYKLGCSISANVSVQVNDSRMTIVKVYNFVCLELILLRDAHLQHFVLANERPDESAMHVVTYTQFGAHFFWKIQVVDREVYSHIILRLKFERLVF